jgi:putative transcriptional regulator
MSKLGKRLLKAADEALAIARGEIVAPRVFVPGDVDVKKIREKLGLTQEVFAQKFGLSLFTVRQWEQNRRVPEGPTRMFLMIIEAEPETTARSVRRVRKTHASGDENRVSP